MRLFPNLRRGVLAALTASLIIASCPAVAAEPPVDLPTLLSVTGPAAFIGKQASESVRLIAGLVNAQGGIRGRMVHVALQDTSSNPSVAVELMNQVKGSHAAAVFGPTFTSECNAVAPLVTEGPLVSCFSPGVHPKPGAFMFSGGVAADAMSAALTTYFRDRGWKRIGLISSTDASGQDFENNFDKVMAEPENHGLQLAAREHFAVTDLSVAAQITRIKAAQPDAVIVWTAGTGLGVALHGIHDVGLDVPIIAGNGNMVRAQLTQYEAFVPKTLLFPGILGMAPSADAPAAVRAAQDQYFGAYTKAGLKPDLPGALAWDPTELLLDAYKATGWNATADQLRSWIASQHNWAGVNGVYDFAKYPQRGIGVSSCVVDRWDPRARDFVAVSKPGGATR